MDNEILTVDEAAGLLKIAPELLLELLMSADLPGRNIGGAWRTTKRALVGFVDGLDQQAGCCGPGMCCTPGAAATSTSVAKSAPGWS